MTTRTIYKVSHLMVCHLFSAELAKLDAKKRDIYINTLIKKKKKK